MMYVSEAYIKMMAEAGVAVGLVVMNGKGPLRNTVGLAVAFVSYVVLLGTVQNISCIIFGLPVIKNRLRDRFSQS